MTIDWLAIEQHSQAIAAILAAQTDTQADDMAVQILGDALAAWLKQRAEPQPHLMMAAMPMSDADLADELRARGVVVTPLILSLLQMFGPAIIKWILDKFGPKTAPAA